MNTDLFQSCSHCWVFQICLHIECNTFTASSFRIWNSSTGILTSTSFVCSDTSKAHLTSHSRMSGSKWVITLTRSDRVPEELWTEVLDIVKEAVIKTILKKKKSKKAKWLSEEALQIAEKWREVKGKGEKERYKHLNTEFQRIARRDKKAFLSDQCKEIEGNNRREVL